MAFCKQHAGHIIGCDLSLNLCEIARAQTQSEVVGADNMTLPFRNGSFDAALSIAVIHHFSNKARREQAVRETLRVLRKGGKALIYAWAFEQELFAESRHRFDTQDVMIPWHHRTFGIKKEHWLQSPPVAQLGRENSPSHGIVNTDKMAIEYRRYCHVFKRGELEDLIRGVDPNVLVDESFMENGNWCVQCTKM
jgi:alkylated DNA repair protein alkB family protein 8